MSKVAPWSRYARLDCNWCKLSGSVTPSFRYSMTGQWSTRPRPIAPNIRQQHVHHFPNLSYSFVFVAQLWYFLNLPHLARSVEDGFY